jgi:predicted transcriptional regulator
MALEQPSVNRCKHDIKCAILSLIADEGPQIKTHIMYKARLSYTQLGSYIPELFREGCIVTEAGHLQITPHGRNVLKILREACA